LKSEKNEKYVFSDTELAHSLADSINQSINQSKHSLYSAS